MHVGIYTDDIKKEPKEPEPSPLQLKVEPQSTEVKLKPIERLEMEYEAAEEMVPAEMMRQVKLENTQLRHQYEELKAKMKHIFRTQSETAAVMKTIGMTALVC